MLEDEVAAQRVVRDATDDGLLARARAGDRDAFDSLARRHVARLVGTARRLLRDPAAAEEAAADALVKAHASLGRLTRDAAFGPWIHRIVLRVALDRVRARRGAPAPLGQGDDEPRDRRARPPSDRLAERDGLERVRRAVDRLPQAQRLSIVLHAWEGLSYAEIAGLLACSYDAVRVNVAHARRSLRTRLADLLDEGGAS